MNTKEEIKYILGNYLVVTQSEKNACELHWGTAAEQINALFDKKLMELEEKVKALKPHYDERCDTYTFKESEVIEAIQGLKGEK